MQKIFVFLFLLICPAFLFGQKKSPIQLISSTSLQMDAKNNIAHVKNPIFQQDNATLRCDSALFYTKRNYFEAFSNVHINQLTTDIDADQLQYDGNQKHAHLTGNVKMTDPTSVLTTNILDYYTTTRIGKYTTGGKIVNQDVTLTSKNGHYFSESNDAYFHYDVVVVTPQTTITSDTLRYNTQTKWTYFYGSTNIKGKDDNLYTENGAYNTMTEDAYFGKKNLYTQGSRSLKGDSLFYYGKKGIGKAVRNIVFSDTKDKLKMKGDLGFYYKKDQRTVVTKNAIVGIGTQDSILVNNKKIADSLWMGADTLVTQMVMRKNLTLIPKISIVADNQIGEDEKGPKEPKIGEEKELPKAKKPSVVKKTKGDKNKAKGKIQEPEESSLVYKEPTDSSKIDSAKKAVPKLSIDSLRKSTELKTKADSLLKNLSAAQKDSLQKAMAKGTDVLVKNTSKLKPSEILKNLPKGTKDSLAKAAGTLKSETLKLDTAAFNPTDTVQHRVIKAFHGVKIYKTNIQAKTDSLFYTSADSTLRCYVNPIIWSEGSQQIGDTIYVQFKKNKLNNLQAIRNAFLVNTPKDSLRFNQIKGRLMTGFFKDGRLKNLYVDGNAESVYYTQDDSTKVYKEMNQTLSSRIKFIFKDQENDIDEIVYIKGIEGALSPENSIAKDHVLKGFSWKPTERPKSKKDAVGSAGKTKQKPSAKKPIVTKAPIKTLEIFPKATPAKKTLDKANPVLKPDTLKGSVFRPDSVKKDSVKKVESISKN